MKELSDKELDELFRKSAEEFEPRYEASDWNDLRRRLDEADGVTGGGWLKSAAPWLVGVLLLLLGGAGAYYYGAGESESAFVKTEKILSASEKPLSGRAATETETSTQTKILPDLAQNDHDTQTFAPELSNSGAENLSAKGEKNRIRKPNRKVYKAASSRRPIASEEIKELPRNPASVSGVRKPTDPNRERGDGAILLSKRVPSLKSREGNGGLGNESTLIIEESPASKVENESVEMESKSRQSNSSNNPVSSFQEKQEDISLRNEWLTLSKLSAREMLRRDAPSFPTIAYRETESSDTATPEKAVNDVPLWSVRIGIAPDLSTVRMSEMMTTMRPGPSASLLVDFNLNDNWSLQTGVIRSLKNYNAQFDDYNGSEEWGNDPMPASIYGDCRVFELPVNLRYDFGYNLSSRQKARWFVGAGVSSYKMQSEKYTYNYPSYSSGRRAPKEMAKGTGWYFLSHANVSVGYEHRLTRRLSVVAEPYLKVPLRGVGWGKVNLFSAGIWFSARYTPVFKKSIR
ncbi:hypothetical protein [Persicitalea sp.]|uniref:hypothetical protein n=1 Tax=Persicitalea sp. TaxID=3100273 RepID=UPI0035949098